MQLNLLGSGGVVAPPKPCCNCRICQEARYKGIPFSRTGASLYINDAELLIDTPEEVRSQLNREEIKSVKNIILSHWHPDHTLGLRIVEHLNYDCKNEKPINDPISVYIAPEQFELMKKKTAGDLLVYFESKGIIKIQPFEHNKTIHLGALKVTPLYIPTTKGYYFLITDNKSKVIYAPCEYKNLKLYEIVNDIDVFIAHCLYFEDKSIGSGVDYFATEDSFETMLRHSKKMNAKKIVITHIEEAFGLSHNELNDICKNKFPGYLIEFGYDGMKMTI